MARILIIDDEALVRYTIRDALGEAGHEVSEAENGEVGLARLAAAPVDLVITDILMPEKEGLATIGEIKARWPALPVIAISGGGRVGKSGFAEAATALGADAALAKPFTAAELLAAVRECLEG